MKTRKIEKKLELSKTTVANLNNQEMNMVQAGGSMRKGCLTSKTPLTICC